MSIKGFCGNLRELFLKSIKIPKIQLYDLKYINLYNLISFIFADLIHKCQVLILK